MRPQGHVLTVNAESMPHNGRALQRSRAPLNSSDSTYPGLRPTVRLIAEFALRGQGREPIHKAARKALRQAGVDLLPIQKQTPEWRERAARAVYEWMGPNVDYAYDPEGIEQVQEPTATLMLGQGDCDDMVSLAIAMLTSVGVPARIKVIRQNGSDVFNHIYAEYQGTEGGRSQWKPFDPTLRRSEKGEYGRAGDGPDPSLIAEAVEVPVTGAPGNLGPRTEASLRNLPADAGVVPDHKLQRESSQPKQTAPSAMNGRTRSPTALSQANPTGQPVGGQSTAEDPFPTSGGDLTRSGRAPGTSKAITAAEEKETVVVVSPERYTELVEQSIRNGDFECTTEGRMVIRDPEGREILPSSEVQAEGLLAAGIPGWVVPFLFATGGVALFAALTREDPDEKSDNGQSSQ